MSRRAVSWDRCGDGHLLDDDTVEAASARMAGRDLPRTYGPTRRVASAGRWRTGSFLNVNLLRYC